MRILKTTLKTFTLGTLFLSLELVACVVISFIFSNARVSSGHATGLSAVIGSLLEAAIWFLLSVLVAYGAAFWIVKRYTR